MNGLFAGDGDTPLPVLDGFGTRRLYKTLYSGTVSVRFLYHFQSFQTPMVHRTIPHIISRVDHFMLNVILKINLWLIQPLVTVVAFKSDTYSESSTPSGHSRCFGHWSTSGHLQEVPTSEVEFIFVCTFQAVQKLN